MKKRIFVGIEISEEAKNKTAEYIESLRQMFPNMRVGWEKKEKLHLTLKFLGEIEERQIEKLLIAVRETSRQVSAFKLCLAETGVFPKLEKARVLWIDIKDEKGFLHNLNLILETECEKQDFKRESRNFKPHLTIARLREPENSSNLIEKHRRERFEPIEFEVSEIVVFQSILQSRGSVYGKIESVELMNRRK